MARYAIGDLQGCYDTLRALLDRIAFDPAQDQLWLVGDLVNRGPASLEVLRFVRGLGDAAITVLGNHDLHLLNLVHGGRQPKARDTLGAILDAPDCAELADWLRSRPLLHRDPADGLVMVHAGLAPQWTVAQAQALAREVEQVLRGPDHAAFYPHMYGDQPACWSDQLRGTDRLRAILNFLTRVRMVDQAGGFESSHSGPPDSAPPGLVPWFDHPGRRSRDQRIVIGHWSALGLQRRADLLALDTGCVWGASLTAVCLDGGDRMWQEPCEKA